ncbi:hypothetical protein GGI23_000216 [Coemansia sp. RSA 2559]|nr:hypothetical protein GGI23_000216 [Coemansia sp. RSA 2559]
MCGCAKDIAIMITGIYENGDTEPHYDYCENVGDGRGFTAGIAGFCTGTGDAWMVVEEYKTLTGSYGGFEPMVADLEKYAKDGSGSTSGLDSYCKVWKSLGTSDTNFQKAQDDIRDQQNYDPAEAAANNIGLKLDVSQGQIYDTGIQQGTGDDADGLLSIIKETSESFTSNQPGDSGSTLNINGHQVDEIVWLKKFIEVRVSHLMSPKEKDNQSGNAWAKTTYRTDSYSYIIDQKEYMWTKSVDVLDNDGKRTTVTCSNSNSPSTRRKRRDINGKPIRIRRKRDLVSPSGSPKKRIARPEVIGKNEL